MNKTFYYTLDLQVFKYVNTLSLAYSMAFRWSHTLGHINAQIAAISIAPLYNIQALSALKSLLAVWYNGKARDQAPKIIYKSAKRRV